MTNTLFEISEFKRSFKLEVGFSKAIFPLRSFIGDVRLNFSSLSTAPLIYKIAIFSSRDIIIILLKII